MTNAKSNDKTQNKKQEVVKSLHAHRRRVFFALFFVVVICLVIAGILFFGLIGKKTENIAATPLSEEAFSVALLDIQSSSRKVGVDSAVQVADEAVSKTNDNYQKTVLLIAKANIYYDNQDYDKALEVAFDAESIEKNTMVYGFIAVVYERKGDNQKAIEYYQKTIDLIKAGDLEDESPEYYEEMIKTLDNQL